MNKKLVIFSGILLSIILSFVLVSAVEDAGLTSMINSISSLVESIYNAGVQPLAEFMIGSDASQDVTKFFTLIVFLVLLLSILYEITARVPVLNNNGWIQFIVSFVVSIISIRFLATQANSSWFETVLMPNQALGIIILCALPLVIYWFFVMDIGAKSRTLAKILWIFAAVVFAILYFTRADELGKSGEFNPATIYLLAAAVSIIFLIFDGTFRRYFRKIKMEQLGARSLREAEIEVRRKITDLNRDVANNVITVAEAQEIKKDLLKQLKYFTTNP